MLVDELRQLLKIRPVPSDAYRLEDGVADEAYVLDRQGPEWVVYYSERGLRAEERRFSSETEACAELYRRLSRSYRFSEDGDDRSWGAIDGFIAEHMSYLWEGARFHVVESAMTTHNGGDSTLLVESDHLRLRFVQDKSQLFLDLGPVEASGKEWYSVDLVRRLYLGEREYSAVLDESYAEFLREHIVELDARFAPDRWPATRTELQKLKKVRTKES